MDTNLVAADVLVLKGLGSGDGATTDDEEGGSYFYFVEILEEVRGVGTGPIVKGYTPGEFIGTGDDVCGSSAMAATRPPTGPLLAGVGGGGGVVCTSAKIQGGETRDRDARVSHLVNPSADLGGVCRRRLVERRVVGGVQCADWGLVSAVCSRADHSLSGSPGAPGMEEGAVPRV